MARGKIEPKAIGAGLVEGAVAALCAYLLVIQPEVRKWSANAGEARRPLPGDDLIPSARAQVTFAVTIEAAASEVWPWLVQMGYGRAGYYSYDRVDVALRKVLPVRARANGGVPSADRTDRIVPELQHLEVWDVLPALPNAEGGFAVAALEPERSLVLGSHTYTDQRAMREAADSGAPKPTFYWRTSWAFFLEERGRQTTRMLVRNRVDYEPRLLMGLFARLIALPLHFVVQRKQLISIKERAERA
jgi:hypothetical protein